MHELYTNLNQFGPIIDIKIQQNKIVIVKFRQQQDAIYVYHTIKERGQKERWKPRE